jgi:Cft2 family RNA processing exonuclease
LFSGDLGKYDQPIIRDPETPPACDYLVVESTYGNRLHDVERPKEALERIIKDAAAHGSAVLIPAFAVGRAQEIVYFIRELENEKRIPVLPVCVDSPMAAAATQAYARRTEEQDDEYAKALKTNPTPSAHAFDVGVLDPSGFQEDKRDGGRPDHHLGFRHDERRAHSASCAASSAGRECHRRVRRLSGRRAQRDAEFPTAKSR